MATECVELLYFEYVALWIEATVVHPNQVVGILVVEARGGRNAIKIDAAPNASVFTRVRLS